MKRLAPDAVLRMTYADVAATLDIDKVEAPTVSAAVHIFADAGLVEFGEDDDGRFVRFREVADKVDLTATTRFAEGEAERETFGRFCGVVLEAAPDVLESVINRPIYPSNVPLIR
jgi:DNA-binding transcriptional ArsR family regulator